MAATYYTQRHLAEANYYTQRHLAEAAIVRSSTESR